MPLRNSQRAAIACAAAVGLCFLYAATRSVLPDWWRNHGGGIPYVMFWILLWLTFFPTRKSLPLICVLCVLATCLLEALQLWDGPPWFNDFRRTRIGAAWLGYGYDTNDLPPYFLGGLIGYLTAMGVLPSNDHAQRDGRT